MPLAWFYDIESLADAFTLCEYRPEQDLVVAYWLLSDRLKASLADGFEDALADRVHAVNPNFSGEVRIRDLSSKEANVELASTYGLSTAWRVNDPDSPSKYPSRFRIACDTDPGFNPGSEPYLVGYNSWAYDTSMLAMYLLEVFPVERRTDRSPDWDPSFVPTTPERMRELNDLLFSADFKKSMPSFLASSPVMRYDPKTGISTPTGAWKTGDGLNYRSDRYMVRKAMLMTGRHIDASRLNEKQRFVGLKRLIGMHGGQIRESDKLSGAQSLKDADELFDLVAYNVSDVVNLKLHIFDDPVYANAFDQKRQILLDYPDIVYEERVVEGPEADDSGRALWRDLSAEEAAAPPAANVRRRTVAAPDGTPLIQENRIVEHRLYQPDVRPSKVRRNRKTADSTSASIITDALCPYDPKLVDIETVSFMYPSERVAAKTGEVRRDVLDETRDWFYSKFPQPELRDRFDAIYDYYDAIRGKNFNFGRTYLEAYGTPATAGKVAPELAGTAHLRLPPRLRTQELSKVEQEVKREKRINTCLPYFDADGNETSCFAVFSVGGIHGQEANIALFGHDHAEWAAYRDAIDEARRSWPDPLEFWGQGQSVELAGRTWKRSQILATGTTMKKMSAEPDPARRAERFYRDVSADEPSLFVEDVSAATGQPTGKGFDIHPKYTMTSIAACTHEDFSSYYPNLLIRMSAFANDSLGYDRYLEQYEEKQRLGALMKDPSLTPAERRSLAIRRSNTKLILNSASGAANSRNESNALLSNTIISMRIIGQLFAWRIGQAQTLAGAKVISTNTDGLYVIASDQEENDRLLRELEAEIGIEIEPEPMLLASKDTNNRMEAEIVVESHEGAMPDGTPATFVSRSIGRVLSCAGGQLSCADGPDATKSLDHPAVIDWALSRYLLYCADETAPPDITQPLDEAIGAHIISQARSVFGDVEALRMFQNVLASSPGTYTIIYGVRPEDPSEPIVLQHYNRVFMMVDGYDRRDPVSARPQTMQLRQAIGRKTTPAMVAKRKRDGVRLVQHEPIAKQVLDATGVTQDMPSDREASTRKAKGIGMDWNMLIENRDLSYLDQGYIDEIFENLDYARYLANLKDVFDSNWRNNVPDGPAEGRGQKERND